MSATENKIAQGIKFLTGSLRCYEVEIMEDDLELLDALFITSVTMLSSDRIVELDNLIVRILNEIGVNNLYLDNKLFTGFYNRIINSNRESSAYELTYVVHKLNMALDKYEVELVETTEYNNIQITNYELLQTNLVDKILNSNVEITVNNLIELTRSIRVMYSKLDSSGRLFVEKAMGLLDNVKSLEEVRDNNLINGLIQIALDSYTSRTQKFIVFNILHKLNVKMNRYKFIDEV